MANQHLGKLIKELFDKVADIRTNSPAGVFGTTSRQSMLSDLVKSVGELGKAVQGGEPYEVIIKKHEEMAMQVDSAGITGLITESEIAGYYELVDAIWAAIEKEN